MHLCRCRWLRLALVNSILGGPGLAACGDEAKLAGTELRQPVTCFTLIDRRGQMVSLRGQGVALTFIYTNCSDVCPMIAAKMRLAHESVPENLRDDVAQVAITVDPERDTPEALRAFSSGHQLADNPQWFVLTGERDVVEPVWRDYGIGPGDLLHDGGQHGDADRPSGGSASAGATPELLAHTDAIYFIGRDGRKRAHLRSDADAETITDNLHAFAE